jgi:L-ascorbate metabolism protein UlaG (beta-lactamase superfamily)
MDIEYKGGNCVIITTKKTTLAVDAKLSPIGLKDYGAKAQVQLATQPQFAVEGTDSLVFEGPGEYEVENISIKGIAAQAHLDAKGEALRATMFRLTIGDIALAIVGHIHPDLSEAQLEALGVIDILVVPVGGNGYTLDATGAVQLVKTIDPKVVIPTHYKDGQITYEVPQQDLEVFLKDLGAPHQESPKLKLKQGLPHEALTVEVLTRTA